ncbi:ABC transporter substrate-binding protein [Candidatus Cyanaurora vandensis]|uniref:substrate-binding periplasmic protein n=1 Tax=Candidatus Cyanaurora vandensis TaxID=2714958 RepID=UPI00257AA04C|nr:transporter substrate-binding domain-containing protein [Candidatus Cyanaurora vandensis]
MRRRQWLIGLGFTMPGVLAQTDAAWSQIEKRGVLRVAADPSLGMPYFALNPTTGQYQGFEWELLQGLERVLGIQVQVTEVLWPQQRQVLRQGGVDVLFNLQEAPDLQTQPFLLTRPYYLTSQTVLTHTARSLTGIGDLVGARVGVLKGSGGAALVDAHNLYRAKGIRPFAANSAPELIQKLQQRQLEAVVLDTPLAQWLSRGTPLSVAPLTLLPVPLVGVVRQDEPSLKNALDRGLQQLKQAGTLEKVLRKWQLWNSLQTRSSLRSSLKG